MIKKLLKVKNIGRFKSFSSINDNLSFAKTTVIFGHNTHGKSTITSIFHSLKVDSPNSIHGRKTFGSTDNQEVEVLYSDNTKSVFPKNNWKNETIEIFDNNFISRNVFYGEHITKDQQSALYEILIGDDVRQAKVKVDNAKKAQSDLEKERDIVKNKFTRTDLGFFDEFLKKADDPVVESKIKEVQEKIKRHQNLEKLKNLIAKTPLKSNFNNFKIQFSKTFDFSIEKSINKHIETNWSNTSASKDFLSQGLKLLKKNGNCVFCGQDLMSVKSFITDLNKVFSDEYKEFREIVKNLGDGFKSIDLEKIFLEFENNGLSLKNKLNYERLIRVKTAIDESVVIKQNDLNLNIDFENDQNFIIFLEELNKLAPIFREIEDLPSGDDNNLNLLKVDLKNLELIKYRFSKEGDDIFMAYTKAESDLKSKKDEIAKLNIDLTTLANKVFRENEKIINQVLANLNANFSIKDFVPKSHMGQVNTHFCDFRFLIDQKYDVLISNKIRQDDLEPDDQSNFKNTLSDSDKRLLAFAFFLAKLGNDHNLDNKIIVLDDPFSSFDENRKDQTIKLLMSLKNENGKEPEQKIILTHDKGFLCRLSPELPKESKVLKIHYSDINGSILDDCDVENEFARDTFFVNIDYIKNSIYKTININEALLKARPCLEHLLKRKYYLLLKTETIKTKSVGDYLTEIGTDCPIKDEILNDRWHEDMHDQHIIMTLNEPAKISKLKRFLELIKKI